GFDGQPAPLDGLAGVSGLETEPGVPGEQSRLLQGCLLAVLVVEHSQASRDGAQCLGIAILPALDPRDLQERTRFGDAVLARQSTSRPVRLLGRSEAADAVPHVAQGFVHPGQLGTVEITYAPSRLECPLVERSGFDTRPDGGGGVGRATRVRPRLAVTLRVQVVQ